MVPNVLWHGAGTTHGHWNVWWDYGACHCGGKSSFFLVLFLAQIYLDDVALAIDE